MVPLPAPLRLRVDQATREAVAERYEDARGAVGRTNCQIVLLADEERHAPDLSATARAQIRSLYRDLCELLAA